MIVTSNPLRLNPVETMVPDYKRVIFADMPTKTDEVTSEDIFRTVHLDAVINREMLRREAIAWNFIVAGAFVNELTAIVESPSFDRPFELPVWRIA